MTTKTLFVSILVFLFTINAGAQSETNPKLVNTFPTREGAVLVIESWTNEIHVSDIKIADLKTMEKTIAILKEQNEKQQKTIAGQKKEISILNQEIRDMKSDYESLAKTLKEMERKLDAIERKLK
jgi:septal ring factor EnvC (AmiA/AmiB activator)